MIRLRALVASFVLAACGRKPALPPSAHALETPVTTQRDMTTVEGVVETHDGKPARGAVVAFVGMEGKAFAVMHADEQGHFRARRPNDRFAVTATSALGTAAYIAPAATKMGDPLRLELGAEGGLTIEGTLAVKSGAMPAETFVAAARHSPDEGDTFFAAVSTNGGFSLAVPPGSYTVRPNGDALVARPTLKQGNAGERVTVSIAATERVPAPNAVIDWLRTGALPIGSTDPGTDTSDLAPLAKLLANARVIGVGEATHGTREYFRFKHRLLERLVTHHGLTLLAMEANFSDAERLDAWLQTGQGTVDDAMNAGLFRVWRTEEVRELLVWMRAWNADKAHKKKLHLRGYDVQGARASIAALRAHFEKVEPKSVESLFAGLAPIDVDPNARGMVTLDEAASKGVKDAVTKLTERLQSGKATATTPLLLQHTRVIEQARARFVAKTPAEQFAARDKAMAENVVWLSDQLPKEERVFVWAHNGHVQLDAASLLAPNMGVALREKLGDRYVSVGFVLDEGTYRAWVMPFAPTIADVSIGPREPGWAAEAFARAGHPMFAVDLRTAPTGVVHDWLFAPRVIHSCGWLVDENERRGSIESLGRLFDVAVYLGKTTSARQLPRKP